MKPGRSSLLYVIELSPVLGFIITVPSLSCGSHPGLVDTTIKNFGNDVMMSLGGSLHGHPDGTISGAKAMRQAFDINNDKNLKDPNPLLPGIYKTDPFLMNPLFEVKGNNSFGNEKSYFLTLVLPCQGVQRGLGLFLLLWL